MPESSRVRVIPYPNDTAPRVETGAVRFGGDWPGLFVRGDNAVHLAQSIDAIERFLATLPAAVLAAGGDGLDLARSCLAHVATIVRADVDVRSG